MCNYATSFTGCACASNNVIFYVSGHDSFIPATVLFSEAFVPGQEHSYSRPTHHLHQTVDRACQSDETEDSLEMMKTKLELQAAKVETLKAEVTTLRAERKQCSFSPETLLPNDDAVRFYTGFVDRATFDIVHTSPQKPRRWTTGEKRAKTMTKPNQRQGSSMAEPLPWSFLL